MGGIIFMILSSQEPSMPSALFLHFLKFCTFLKFIHRYFIFVTLMFFILDYFIFDNYNFDIYK